MRSELAKLPLDSAAFILDPKFREELGKSHWAYEWEKGISEKRIIIYESWKDEEARKG